MSSSSSQSGRKSKKNKNGSQDDKYMERKAQCIRNVANFSKVKSFHLMEKGDFAPDLLNIYIEHAAPKIKALFEKIEKLDEKDMRTHGKHFKHMIFTDVKSSTYGAKIISSAFYAAGYHPALHVQGSGFTLYDDEKLLETKGTNFGVLMSKTFYDRSMNSKFRKNMITKFNQRPENVNGDLMRFIILDQGFKEGIDLFDVKYIHLFEPLVVKADEKQAIGRGTRFCGQKALEFHPRYGWPLYVFRYEVSIPEEYQADLIYSKQMFDLYLKFSNLDLRKVVFAAELEKAAIEAAVDIELTKPIHNFKIELPPPILDGGAVLRSSIPRPPQQIMDKLQMQRHIASGFMKFKYPEAKLENLCLQQGGNPQIVSFTPTQDFVRHFFQPSSAYKGLLLFHSVGTGKTCSAIATATTSFEKEGYTILWVTRHTLKSDIWKNMFQQVCSLVIQEGLKDKSLKLPSKIGSPMKYVSKYWMEPISYKQFSNMLLKKNKIYDEMVRRNGVTDPLRKTLVIIDEAHKVYSPTVAASEKPNTNILENMVQKSYRLSGKDSVRILAMTGTPYTEDGMEMIRLLNLLREKKDLLPADFDKFSKMYLDEDGFFRNSKLKKFQDDISGYISYLNRSQDARNFAHPVLENVFVPLTSYTEEDHLSEKYKIMIQELKAKMKALKPIKKEKEREVKYKMKIAAREIKERGKDNYRECLENIDKQAAEEMDALKKFKEDGFTDCTSKPVKERKDCKEKIKTEVNTRRDAIKEKRVADKEKCKDHKKIDPDKLHEEVEKLKDGFIKDVMEEDPEFEQEWKKLNEDMDRIKNLKKETKEIMETIRDYKAEFKNKKATLKEMRDKLNKERKKIRAIKNKEAKKKAQKELRETLGQELKGLLKDVLDIRNNISNKTNEKTLLLIKSGKKGLGDVSQLTALEKRCDTLVI